jgi:hypothetical protein
MGYSKKEDDCGNRGSTTTLSMIGYSSGELTARPAQWKVSPLNSKRAKQFLQSQAFGVSKSPKPMSALTSGLEASGSGMNSELEMPPPET